MHCSALSVAVMILIASSKLVAQPQSAEELVEFLSEKILRLEATNRINGHYEPYLEPELQDDEEYDFIIVGSGSSGSAVIRRLSEIADWKILVLEAGGEPNIISDATYWSPLAEAAGLDWGFYTEIEDNFGLGLADQRMHWTRGKVLGGTSVLEYMIFNRGAKKDYDLWASLGNPGWSYDDVLPLFKKLETCNIKRQDKKYRGHDGPIFVEDAYVSKGGRIFVKAAKNAGYRYVDYNGRRHEGVSYCQANTKHGLRCSGESCYIKPIKDQENLTIRLNSHVTKVLIENESAYGVEFIKNGKIYRARAKKEVILSAGAINSPHILLLSGIGPKEQLLNFGIEPIKDLPVGQKLYDHPTYLGLGFTTNESITNDVAADLEDKAFIDLYNNGTGVLHALGGAESLLFWKSPLAASNEAADIQLIFFSSHFSQDFEKGLARVINLSEDFYDRMYKSYEGQNAVTCIVILMHPESFGHLELRSSYPFDHPKIYGGFLTDPEGKDIKTLTAGIKEAIRVMLSPPFDKYDTKVMDIETPVIGCETFEYDSDDYWACALKYVTTTGFHLTTTCKMGPPTDPEAVVDNKLKVYGINNLRVADTSIIPIHLSGKANAPAFLVGEKAAEIVKEEYLGEILI